MSAMSRFTCIQTPLAGLVCLERQPVFDERGFFSRFFCHGEWQSFGFEKPIAQINHSMTREAGGIRGLHYQHPPHAEMKAVSCLQGAIFDVAVDLRRASSTFLQWHGEVLSAENRRTLVIPEGFAHGFQALSPNSEILYLSTADYHPSSEGGIHPLDPVLGISWPLPVASMSNKDRQLANLAPDFGGIAIQS